jgi:hypothetical protein
MFKLWCILCCELLCNLWWWPLDSLRSWLLCELVWNPSWFHGLPGYTGLSLLNRPLVGWFSYLILYNWAVLLQKLALSSLPIVTTVEARKRALSVRSHSGGAPTHGRLGSTHSYQNHLNLRALLNLFKSRIPSPPKALGLAALGHITRQCPPLTFSSSFQRKPLLILSIYLIAHFLIGKTVRKCTSIEDNTEFTKVSRPCLSRNFAFQDGRCAATLSIIGCTSTLRSGLTFRGRPKYLYGNALTSKGRTSQISLIIVLLHVIGYTTHF